MTDKSKIDVEKEYKKSASYWEMMESPYKKIIVIVFGMVGLHYFLDNKTAKGILYLFTVGLFCVGWILDIYKILRDHTEPLSKTEYIPNLKKTNIIFFVISLVVIFFGVMSVFKKQNNVEYQMYKNWKTELESSYKIYTIDDFEDIEIKSDDGKNYYATVKYKSENLVEEIKSYQSYCSSYVNENGKVVDNLTMCIGSQIIE